MRIGEKRYIYNNAMVFFEKYFPDISSERVDEQTLLISDTFWEYITEFLTKKYRTTHHYHYDYWKKNKFKLTKREILIIKMNYAFLENPRNDGSDVPF